MKYVVLFGALIVVAFLAVLYFIPLGIEPLTEVYFENHTSLRANNFPNVTYNFTFTIHNLEYQDMNYKYNISAFDVNGTFIKELSKGEVYLGNNMSQSVFVKYNLPKGFERTQVKVLVTKDDLGKVPDYKKKFWWPDPNYPTQIDVHFWVDEVTGPKVIFS